MVGALLALLGAGCATTEMKGTPFYTGEYSKRLGPAEERVNIWPLLYYRSPALSVLWPIFEHTDTHLAARPVFSVYGLDHSNHQYNVLWPLAQFDRQTQDNRIFPFFWGGGSWPADDYRVGFPLYWHFGHPLDDKVGGLDALFPLWSLSRHGTNSASLYCPWPLVHFMHKDKKSGWHVFPLAGSYGDGNKYFRFQAAFLASQWGNAREERAGSMVLPLYGYGRRGSEWDFYSLLWSGGQGADSRWNCLLPVFYHRTNTTGSLTLSPLWLQGGAANPGDGGWSALLPLFYRSYGATGSTTLSPLWLAHAATDTQEKSWQALLPLFYHSGSKESDLLLTPLWSQGASSNACWQFLLPLYYARQEGADKFWATPLGGLRNVEGQKSWMIYPLLSWGAPRADGGEFWALAPFVHAAWNQTNSQSHVMPFYYYNSGTHTFLSLPWARWADAGGTNSVVPPLLSWVSSDAESSDLWLALGLGKFSWGAQPGSQYLLPFFYHDRARQMLLSPVWAQWQTGKGSTALVPPLLSWKETSPQRSDFHLLLFFGKFSWGEQPGSQWLFPLFYHDRSDRTFVSLPWARWHSPSTTNSMVPLTLSWLTEEEQCNNFWLALGLGKFSWGKRPGSSWLLPIYYHDPESHTFYTLPYGRKPEDFTYYATPLVGKREGDQAGSWVFPLYSHKRDTRTGDVDDWVLWGNRWERNGVSRSVFFPVFGYHNFGPRDSAPKSNQRWAHFGKDFFCIPFCWYNNETYLRPSPEELKQTYAARRNKTAPPPQLPLVREDNFGHGVFPLWRYKNVDKPAEGRSDVAGSFLLWLYEYNRTVGPLAQAPAGTNDYTRSRVLWHLWHYERLNDDVSVDVFPGFTYDRKNDGFKKFSWLWRFFRYERSKDGGKKLDVLFIPFMRSEGKATDRQPLTTDTLMKARSL
jgi:hypothetical protein